jgi:hypothetical protein
MASKQEIKDLFIAELKNTPEYNIVLDIKRAILFEIATPNIQAQLQYNFSSGQSDEQVQVIKMCLTVEFGFSTTSISSACVVIAMADFL